MKKNKLYSRACTRLGDKKMISSLVYNPCSSVFQGGHVGGELDPHLEFHLAMEMRPWWSSTV
jgi:hypothetical protein